MMSASASCFAVGSDRPWIYTSHVTWRKCVKLLVVSHACATPSNQSFFEDVEALAGWSVTLVLPESWKTEYAERTSERWAGFQGEFCPVPVWKSGNIPLHAYRTFFVNLLRRTRPDAIYVHHEPYGLATAQVYLANRLLNRVPIGFYAAQNMEKVYPIPFRWTEQLVLRESAFCFPVTQSALEVLHAKGFHGRAEVLPLAVDRNLYFPQPQQAAAIRQRLGIRESEPVIGYLGRLVEEKGLVTLVHALKLIEAHSWRCVLVGNGPLEAQLRSELLSLGLAERVIFPGYVPHTEAAAWLSMFDILALPSETRTNWKEQFGRVIVEANACGTPVVGTQCGEIPTVLRHTGGGLIVAEANPEEFASALQTLLLDPGQRQALAESGRNTVREQYDQHYLVSRFVATIQNGLGQTASP